MRFLAATALLAFLLVSCGGGDATSPRPEPGTAGQPGTVTIDNFSYRPPTLEVPLHTNVTWTNQDTFGHTVTSGRPGAQTPIFDGVLGMTTDGKGKEFTFMFDEPGTYPYFCRIHQNMVGEVRVSG
ncbi:MAG: plastocyanin/azurin family copper-binding protein [Actinomycetota bacterium]|nr:plastocyanin/azurin family copper-binding protein [Actinomycetota bacterium]